MAATISPPTNYASKPNTTINDLCDDLLIEIFCRLPCKTLFSCKSVSKHWFTLVSNPNFHSIYLTHQHTLFQILQTKGDDSDQQSFILESYDALVITPNIPSLQFDGFLQKHLSLSFLDSYFKPTPKLRHVSAVVFGCSNGLLLCGNSRHRGTYHVCNPLTRDTLELPALPRLSDISHGVLLGFMCDPYYHVELEGVSVVTSLRRFRVVRIPKFDDKRFAFNVEVFSSETGKWNRLVVSCPKGFEFEYKRTTRVGVEHDGKLYFMGRRMILVYDPYNVPQVANVIDYPSDFGHEIYTGCLGVSCGRLQFSEFDNESVRPHNRRVWELEEYFDCGQTVKAAWRLVHEFYLPPDIIGPILEELTPIWRDVSRYSRIIAFHPYVRGNVFLDFGNHFRSCNLLTMRYKANGGLSMLSYPVIPFVIPWWPTPIPSLPSSLDHCL